MIIPVGFGQITFRFTGSALPHGAAVVLGFDHDGSKTAFEYAEDGYAVMASTILGQLTDDIQLTSTLVKLGPEDDGPSAEYADVTAGGYNTATAPPNVALLVRKNTALGGRRHRGRMYLPGVAEGDVNDDGSLESIYHSNVNGQVSAFGAALVLQGMDPVLLHDQPSTGVAPAPTPIDSFQLQTRVATQRRRLRR